MTRLLAAVELFGACFDVGKTCLDTWMRTRAESLMCGMGVWGHYFLLWRRVVIAVVFLSGWQPNFLE